MKRSSWALLLSLCCLVSLAVLWPGRTAEFLFDDHPNIVDNAKVHLSELTWPAVTRATFSYEPGHGSRPLAMLSFALDHLRAGLDATAFRDTNLLLHGLTLLALAAMVRRLLLMAQWAPRRAEVVALVVALAWGAHPLQVSSVLYVVQRMQTLGTFFVVLGLWSCLNARSAQIDGRPSLRYWIFAAVSGVLGVLCKEDVLLLPGYTWILELTVLQFRASDPRTSARWRRGYQVLVGLGAAAFLLLVVPRYWTSEPYAWRSFSSLERLLTEARILVMYLGQMLWPLPQSMPFYYDQLEPSRGLLSPPTTLLSLLLLAGLLGLAWALRARRPVFAAGVMLFFMGHFLTSNVLNLELAFEHRNHFPLIGFLLALADGACLLADRLKPSRGVGAILVAALMATLCTLTYIRASIWGSSFQFALQGPDWAPQSGRAWQLLCKTYYLRSGGETDHPMYSLAVNSCQKAADLRDELIALADLITLKTMQGAKPDADWDTLVHRIEHASFSPEGRDVLWIMIGNASKGVDLDSHQLVRAAMAYAARFDLTGVELANLANYILYQSKEPEKAYAYYLKALRRVPAGDPMIEAVLRDLEEHGMKEWADRLRKDLAG